MSNKHLGERTQRRYALLSRHKQVRRAGIGKQQRLRQAMVRQPTILLISSNPTVLATVHVTLSKAHFAVFATTSPLDGYDYALSTLGITLPARAMAILIDTSNVYSILVAAGLAQRMQQRAIPPTWLIALLDTQDPERALEARLAGCQHVLQLPLAEATMRTIQQLLKRPALLPHGTTEPHSVQVIQILQTIADRMLHAALEVQPDQWTAHDVMGLLYHLTAYPLYSRPETKSEAQRMSIKDMSLRTEQIIRTLGGIQAAREFLADCVRYLEPQYPLHSEILGKFLDGWQRKEIVRNFVERGLYEDTRIYACIKELPQRVSDILRVPGA